MDLSISVSIFLFHVFHSLWSESVAVWQDKSIGTLAVQVPFPLLKLLHCSEADKTQDQSPSASRALFHCTAKPSTVDTLEDGQRTMAAYGLRVRGTGGTAEAARYKHPGAA